MKFLQRIVVCICILFFCIPQQSKATHLMGGSLTYQYLGLNSASGQYQYLITVTIYRYCEGTASNLPNNINFGAYQDNPLNPTGDKSLVQNNVIPLVSQQFIQPPSAGDSCNFTTTVCVEEGIYQQIISVPPNTSGYYFISDRCCRNGNIINLTNPGGDGQAYFAYAPTPTVVNNSPTFAIAPVPFICANDTASILNQASDIDGDLLSYHFVTPFNGIANSGMPNPNPPNTYPWPIPTVGYASGFSVANPFGAGGYASIDTLTGLTSYYATTQGFYVLAVEINEYRNGVLIGVTRRDLQIIVIICPSNPAPSQASATLQTTFSMQEGQTLCFSSSFNDANGDSIFLTHTGAIFNSVLTNPAATFTDTSNLATATGQFCWTTSCSQGRSTSYQFSVNARDNGCPAKITNIVYTINVANSAKPVAITGLDTICANTANGIQYSVLSATGYTYNWIINNGVIATGAHAAAIGVNFTNPGPASVSIVAINQYGCPSDTLTKQVYIQALPVAIAGTDKQFCSAGNAVLGAAAQAGYTYSWSPSIGLNNSLISNPTVTITNVGTTPVSTSYFLTSTFNGCTNKDTVVVTANPYPVANAGADVLLCSGSAIGLGTSSIAGYTYNWIPTTGLNNSTLSNPSLTLNNITNTPDTLYYIVQTQNGFLCSSSDTVRVISSPIPNANAGTDISFCSGGNGTIGASAISGYAYSWSPSAGLSNATISNTGVTLTTTKTVNDTVRYILTTNWLGCPDKDTVNVIVRPNPVSNAGNNQLLCAGSSIQLGTSNTIGYAYVWTPASGLNNTTISNPTLTLINTNSSPDTLNYLVTTTLNGCTTNDSVQVISSPVPNAVAGNDVAFCSGQSVTIGTTAVGGYTYSWSPSTGLNNVTSATPSLSIQNGTAQVDTVNYIMTVNWFGCIDKDTIVAFVKPLPVSNAGLNATLCNGDTLRIGTAVTSGYTYSWTPSLGLNSTTISNPLATASNGGSGQFVVTYVVNTFLNGCTTNDSIDITINPSPIVVASANPQSICFGTSATLNASGATNYTWALFSNPGTSIGSGNSISVSPTISTSYILTGASSVSCVNRDTILITVNPVPIVTLTSLSDSICFGDTLSLNGGGANSYSWSISGISGAIGSGSSIQVSPQTTTTYVVSGTDANLCSNTDTLAIKVNPSPTAASIIGTRSVCPGVTGVQYWISNPNASSTYNWVVINGSITSGQGTDTIMVDWAGVSGSGTVEVIEVTDKGCTSKNPIILPITINIILIPVAPTGTQTLCANLAQGINYTTINTPGSTYNWFASGGSIVSGNGSSSVVVDWTVAGPQSVKLWYEETSVTNVTVCFGVSDTLTIIINPIPITSAITGTNAICVTDTGSYSVINASGSTFSWSNSAGNVLTGNGSNAISANWTSSGPATINVQETNSYGCLGNTVSIPVTVNALPNINAGTDPVICEGKDAQLIANGGIIYSWSPSTGLSNASISNPIANPTSTTTYIVLGIDGNGCKNADTIKVTVNTLPPANAGLDASICIGKSTVLNASGGTSYLWSPASTLDNSAIPNPNANPTINTTYSVIVTDNNGCSKSDDVEIIVNPLPVAVVGPDVIICAGSGITLNASGGLSFFWSPSTGLSSAVISNPVANPTATTLYNVEVTDVNGCKDDTTIEVGINPQPKALFEVDSNSISIGCTGVEVSLINNSSYADNYNWNFGDGSSSMEFNPSHLYGFGSDKLITLYAINKICSDSLSINFSPSTISNILANVPNVFTPNADGKNDCFTLGLKVDFDDCSEWTIYNRWGQQVFHSSKLYPCWNGKKNTDGENEPAGTYFFILEVAGNQYKGTISLIR